MGYTGKKGNFSWVVPRVKHSRYATTKTNIMLAHLECQISDVDREIVVYFRHNFPQYLYILLTNRIHD